MNKTVRLLFVLFGLVVRSNVSSALPSQCLYTEVSTYHGDVSLIMTRGPRHMTGDFYFFLNFSLTSYFTVAEITPLKPCFTLEH